MSVSVGDALRAYMAGNPCEGCPWFDACAHLDTQCRELASARAGKPWAANARRPADYSETELVQALADAEARHMEVVASRERGESTVEKKGTTASQAAMERIGDRVFTSQRAFALAAGLTTRQLDNCAARDPEFAEFLQAHVEDNP